MFKVLVPAVAALGLVAFAAKTQDWSHEDAEPSAVSAMAQPVMGWHLSYEGPMAKLAYGVENSDQLALMVTCAPGDRSAVVYGDVLPASPRLAQASLGSLEDEARIPVTDPALQSLARNGVMPVVGEAGPTRIHASDAERRVVSGFLSYCDQAAA
ncbi:hypothetical protein IFJ75_03570 [Brevundimonas goettingensis]|uniref:Uncharacterized protein n=2 Tax=Brevundimonas goettingensis TaxID=2774190 RepID=A0A975C5D7_9CAUL|nr:hypothetical protein IFJ75_03570 [Brevundimonas goettingensis]